DLVVLPCPEHMRVGIVIRVLVQCKLVAHVEIDIGDLLGRDVSRFIKLIVKKHPQNIGIID
ncbi:hypothetical protein LJD42_28010, partial [Escherichia coli]|nr:hypothetical protein [Escherichia coli]